jgi:YfiH family protein
MEVRKMDVFRPKNQEKIMKSDEDRLILAPWGTNSGLTAGFTTRHAGNMALHIGDDPQRVAGNRIKIAESLGWDFSAWTCAEQVHGVHVHVVESGEAGRGRLQRSDAILDSDALITDESNILLVMYFADCVPLYFFDPVTGAMALAHAGWKGTVGDVVHHTVSRLRERYGVVPSDLRAAIGPSIGGCCYEVDEAVLQHVRPFMEECAKKVVFPSGNSDKAKLDLKLLNVHLMIKAGILPSRIELSDWCTGCRTDLFFSHRMEHGNTGRMMSWIGKKSG